MRRRKWSTKGLLAAQTPPLPLVLAACAATGAIPTDTSAPPVSQAAEQQVLAAYGKLPLAFEANRGQSDSQVKFLARGPEHTLFLTSTEPVLVVTKREPPPRE